MRSRRGARGFTLLEVLVTLVVASLIVAVLMQALHQAIGLRTRLLRHERDTRMDSLQEQWFRVSVASSLYDLPDAMGQFRGSADGFSVVSAAPLDGQGPARIEWALARVDGGLSLQYADGQWDSLTVIAGPLREASFAYLDASGDWQAEWQPPEEPVNGVVDEDADAPLPRMVRLVATTSTGTLSWLAPVAADPAPAMVLRPEETPVGP